MSGFFQALKLAVQSAGSLIGTEPAINFVSGATIADNPGANRVDITLTGGVSPLGGFSTTDSLDAGTILTTETAFATVHTIPSGVIVAGTLLRCTFLFQVSSSAAATSFTFRIRLRGTATVNILATTSITPSNNLSSRSILAIVYIQGTAAAGNSVAVELGGIGPTLPGAQVGGAVENVASPQNIKTNEAQILEATIQYGLGTAGNITQLRQLILETMSLGAL